MQLNLLTITVQLQKVFRLCHSIAQEVEKMFSLKQALLKIKYGNEVKTNASGVAEFKDLPLGIYLVVETTSPAIVTGPCDPFLISVPMTTDGDDWLYNVHVISEKQYEPLVA